MEIISIGTFLCRIKRVGLTNVIDRESIKNGKWIMLTQWRNKKIVLHLHHKNGDHCDNREKNLAIICPNCHSQTENFGNKRRK